MKRNICQLKYALEKNKEALGYTKRLVRRMERWYEQHGEYIPQFGNAITRLVTIVCDLEKTIKRLEDELKSIASK